MSIQFNKIIDSNHINNQTSIHKYAAFYLGDQVLKSSHNISHSQLCVDWLNKTIETNLLMPETITIR